LDVKSKMEINTSWLGYVFQRVIYVIKIGAILQNIIIKLNNQISRRAKAGYVYGFLDWVNGQAGNSYAGRGQRRKSLNDSVPFGLGTG
jgi:hypothetical protein